VAVGSWKGGPPDLCVTSPSPEAADTAVLACARHFVTILDEPVLARRRQTESWDDVAARFAQALLVVSADDTRAALVVCDAVADRWPIPLVLDGESMLERSDN
jgi:hypothetical protein